jgi:AcrR family transcriptional regulator
MSPRKRLTKQDWVEAGLAALVGAGPDAVAIEPVAASLGATKGSGYWHFANRAALLDSVLDLWQTRHTEQVIERVEAAGGSPVARLDRLISVVTKVVRESPADILILASQDPAVRARVTGVVARRIGYIERLLVESGVSRAEARSRAVLAYAAYLGHAVLEAATPEALPHSAAARRRMQHGMLRLALPDDDAEGSTTSARPTRGRPRTGRPTRAEGA